MELFGKVLHPVIFDYEKAFDNEYFFKEGELFETKVMFEDNKRRLQTTYMAINARNITGLITKKRYKGEVRKKVPASVKFIMDEI